MKSIAVLCILLSSVGFAQQPHLEVGAKLAFKDQFYSKPSFDVTSKYTEIHSYEAYFFGRVSKRKFGAELGFGFEKAANYFVRFLDNSKEFGFVNLNRVELELSPFFYLIKTPKRKWDVQLGIRNYATLNRSIWIPEELEMKRWKLAGRFATNYTYKSLIVGLFVEHDFRRDMITQTNQKVFGMSVGVIY